MPGDLSQADYYHYYLSSQRRVERWVRDTEKQLRGLQKDAVPAEHEAVEEEGDSLRHAERRQRHGRTSSKRRNDDRSGSRPSSGGPKKIRRVEHGHGKSPSHSSRRRTTSRNDITVVSYLPYGVLPLLYAFTGSSVVSFAVAAILLIAYMCVDLESRKSSPRRTASN